jgi:hypothetical protein
MTRPSSLALWSGILCGPVAFAINLQLRYALVPWACASGSRWVVTLIAVPLVLVCVAGALLARTGLMIDLEGRTPSSAQPRESAASPPRADGGVRPSGNVIEMRARFMAYSGLMLSAIFAISILASMIPDFFLAPCD